MWWDWYETDSCFLKGHVSLIGVLKPVLESDCQEFRAQKMQIPH